jgi:hypothetical protein
VAVGTTIVVLGNPLGLKGTFSTGVISGIRSIGKNGKSLLQISAPISPGSSGSPVLNLSGDLVGMVEAQAKEGEGIGFALTAEHIWKMLGDCTAAVPKSDPSNEPLAKSRKRYLAGADLAKDPEWNQGKLPEAASQRIAVLRRLRERYPDEAVARIAFISALCDDDNYEQAFDECVSMINADPGNRLALRQLSRVIVKEERKLPIFRSAIKADPLNFRAREYLFRQEGSAKDFLSANQSARRNLETAPFFLPAAEGYAESILDLHLHELVKQESMVYPVGESVELYAIEMTNQLRGIVVLAAQVLTKQTEDALKEFIVAAKNDQERSLPYCWEIVKIGLDGNKEMKNLIQSVSGKELILLCNSIVKEKPLLAEAYLLDFSSVIMTEGLIVEAASDALVKSYFFDVRPPFDEWAMVWLLARNAPSSKVGDVQFDPEYVVRWKKAMDEYARTADLLGAAGAKFYRRDPAKYGVPVLFQFWLSCEKERFEKLLRDDSTDIKGKGTLEGVIDVLKDVPSKAESVRVVRASSGASGSQILWKYFGDEYAIPLKNAFEAAAR